IMFICTIGLAVSCTSSQKKAEGTATEQAEKKIQEADAATLMGDWNILTLNGVIVPQTEETPYLTFNMNDKRLAGMTGCNRVMGDIMLDPADASKISFDRMGSTKMMCHNDSLERAVLAALANVKSFATIPCKATKDAHCIAFYDANKTEIMTLQQEPLINTEFQTTPAEN
ncbi:MAG: META domain-containing protein, partial [Bacteroidales bacterium]